MSRSPATRRAFLAAFAETGNVTAAAAAAGISRSTHYEWLKTDEDYRPAFEEAREMAADLLEGEAFRRAHQGVEEPVYQGGQLVGSKQVYSDSLAVFLLKGLKPQRYRDRASVEHTGPGGAPIRTETTLEIDPSTMQETIAGAIAALVESGGHPLIADEAA